MSRKFISRCYWRAQRTSNQLKRKLLLPGLHADGSTVSTAGLGLLTLDRYAPPVTDTTMKSDLLHALQVLTQLVVQVVTGHLAVLAVLPVASSVQEPHWDLEVLRLRHHSLDLLELGLGELTGALAAVDFGLLEHQVGESAAHTADSRHGVGHLDVTIDVRVLHTQNVLKILRIDKCHCRGSTFFWCFSPM